MDLQTTGMEFASEVVIKAMTRRMKVAELAVTLYPDGRGRPSHLRSWRDGWRHLRFMLLFSPEWLFLYPGIVLMLCGVSLFAWLLPAPRTVGAVTFDIHSLLFGCAMIVVGFNTIAFAFFAKVYAMQSGLMPQSARYLRLFQRVTLETGLATAFLLLIVAVVGAVLSLLVWRRHSFGPLDPSSTMRLVIPSMLALVLCVQTVYASFFLSILGMGRR